MLITFFDRRKLFGKQKRNGDFTVTFEVMSDFK